MKTKKKPLKASSREGSTKNPKKKPAPPKNSKRAIKTPAPTLEERALEALQDTTFGNDGLRAIRQPLERDEYDFSCFSYSKPEEATYVVLYEYQREIKTFYDVIRFFRGIETDVPKSQPSPGGKMFSDYSAVGLLNNLSTFPLPIVTIKRNDESKGRAFEISTTSKPHKALYEISPMKLLDLRLRGESEYFSTHCIVIQRNCNKRLIKSEFSKWLIQSEKEQDLRKRVGRPEATVMDDRLNQLAAYRIHRAGISYNEFLSLKARLPYKDESAFIKGYKKAEEALSSLIQGESIPV
jgi:hypothetical protein